MKKKILVTLFSLVLMLSLAIGVVPVFAEESPAEAEVLAIEAVNYADVGYGAGIMVQLSKDGGTYREPLPAEDKEKLVYKDANGDVLEVTTAETFGNSFVINRGKTGWEAKVGESLTIKAGFSYGGAVLAEEATYYYNTAGAPFTTTPPAPPEPDVEIGIGNVYCYVDKNGSWGVPCVQSTFTNAKDDHDNYWGGAGKEFVAYTSAWGDIKALDGLTYIMGNTYLMRFVDAEYFPMIGDKITFKKDFYLYPNEKLPEEITYVVAVNKNDPMKEISMVTFAKTAEITNSDADKMLPIEAETQLTYKLPDGEIGTPFFTSSDATKATVTKGGIVTGVALGTVTISANLGGKVVDTFEIEVIAKQAIESAIFANVYDVYVLKNGTVAWPKDFTAKVIYESGKEGLPFALTAGVNFIPPAVVVTSAVGKTAYDAKITYKDIDYTVKVNVIVYETSEMIIKEVGIVEWLSFTLFVQVPDSSSNLGNMTTGNANEELTKVAENIGYLRADGTKVDINGVYNLGTNVVIIPFSTAPDGSPITIDNFNECYKAGDKLVLKQGFYNLLWTGKITSIGEGDERDDNAMDPHTGMIIKESVLSEETIYVYDGATWGLYIEYTDLTVAKAEVDLVIGKTVSAGVSRLPSNATVGTITYKSSDETIATVNTLGVIRGIKAGKVTITATITGGNAGNKTITMTANVSDSISGIKFDQETLNVKKGGSIDLSALTAKFKMASGIEGGTVDLTNATISGFDANTLGEQTVVISVELDGKTYSGTIVVTVSAGGGCGCGSNLSGYSLIAVFAALVGATLLVILTRRKTAKK